MIIIILYGQVSFDKIWQNNANELIMRYSHIVVMVLVLVELVVPKNWM
jgi:hypothetical protein